MDKFDHFIELFKKEFRDISVPAKEPLTIIKMYQLIIVAEINWEKEQTKGPAPSPIKNEPLTLYFVEGLLSLRDDYPATYPAAIVAASSTEEATNLVGIYFKGGYATAIGTLSNRNDNKPYILYKLNIQQ